MTSQQNPATGAQEVVTRHIANSRQYLENALVFLQKGEAGKAGELLWGSVTQAIHALAVSRGIALTNHRSLRYFVNQLAKELRDPELARDFGVAEHLHSNFYEVELEPADIEVKVEPVQRTMRKLLALIPGAK